jgi:hypothetical protein
MTRFVIDPPTLVHLARHGPVPPTAHQLVAPNSLRSHALELLLGAVIAGDVGEREALALHERMTGIKVRLLGDRVSRRMAWTLVREFGWDDLTHAEYLAVTRLQADALIAGDSTLGARAAGVVPLATIADLLAA